MGRDCSQLLGAVFVLRALHLEEEPCFPSRLCVLLMRSRHQFLRAKGSSVSGRAGSVCIESASLGGLAFLAVLSWHGSDVGLNGSVAVTKESTKPRDWFPHIPLSGLSWKWPYAQTFYLAFPHRELYKTKLK